MSSSSEISYLNTPRRVALQGVASFIVNEVMHPLCILENRLSAFPATICEGISQEDLFSEYLAMCDVDPASFSHDYSTFCLEY